MKITIDKDIEEVADRINEHEHKFEGEVKNYTDKID
jgi:hypothetical protein